MVTKTKTQSDSIEATLQQIVSAMQLAFRDALVKVPSEDAILRVQDVADRVGLKKASIYNMVNAGRFPVPVELTPTAVGWRKSEIDTWLAELKPSPHYHNRQML